MEEELVSVIVPVYNKEKYIKACLSSLINQKHNNLQIIVINDGSTDGSLDVIKQMAKEEKRIEFINQENQGRSNARNKGIDLVKGSYIVMVDADDTVEPSYVTDMLSIIEHENADCVVCGMNIVGTKTRKVCLNNQEKINVTTEFLYRYIANNGEGLGTSSCNKLFKTSIVQENNIRYKNIEIGEDYIFCLEYAKASRVWCSCNKALYNYIQNATSTMHTYSAEQSKKIYKIYDELLSFAKTSDSYEQFKSAAATGYIKFIFKDALNISQVKNYAYRMEQYKILLSDMEKRNILLDANLNVMSKKYKMFFDIYNHRQALLMEIFVSLYRFYVGGTI